MWKIGANNPSIAWIKATRCILKNGKYTTNFKFKNILGLLVMIKNPIEIDERIHRIFCKIVERKWGEGYKSWHKGYENRIKNYRGEIDQVKYIVERFRKGKTYDDSVITIHDPVEDSGFLLENLSRPRKTDYPCLISLDFKLRENKLNLFAVFRSHDFGRKAYGNYRWLGGLLKDACQKTGCDVGKLYVLSNSAFIQKNRMEKVNKILSNI